MSNMTKHNLLVTVFLTLFFSACSEKKTEVEPAIQQSAPVASPTTAPVVTPLPPTVTPASTPPPTETLPGTLAVLKKLTNRADMRPREKTVWQAANVGAGFFKHDALQTHETANANIRYESGSQLDLKQNTLIIFDKDPGLNNQAADRVLLKNGELVGATKKELWVFTNAGLVQIKAVKKNQQAQAVLKVGEEKKLKVTVNQGMAELILKKSEKEFQKFSLAEKSDFEFKPPVTLNVATDNVDVLAKAAVEVKKTTSAELMIETPADDAVTTQEDFEVRGRMTEMGAKLLINGELAATADDLSFKKTLRLTDGANLVVFQLVRSDASVKFYRKNIRLNKAK